MRNVECNTRMRSAALALALLFAAITAAQADPQIAAAQQALKDAGFYYGEITGTKDADTTAAIRRYQIRNGLQINGELNAETRKSLRLAGGGSTAPAPAPTRAPATAPSAPPIRQATPPPDTSDLRDDRPAAEDDEVEEDDTADTAERFPSEPVPRPGYAPGPRGLYPDTSGVFEDTPYEVAPPDLQRQVLIGAQMRLARQGYYRSAIDGIYGPAMEAALSAYQLRAGLEPTGVLDMDTLNALGLLPGRGRPGMRPPSRSMRRPGVILAPNGERVYVPR
jgi:peptidoglycan hydrolase-like protein with peptidoglycan-binding domain